MSFAAPRGLFLWGHLLDQFLLAPSSCRLRELAVIVPLLSPTTITERAICFHRTSAPAFGAGCLPIATEIITSIRIQCMPSIAGILVVMQGRQAVMPEVAIDLRH